VYGRKGVKKKPQASRIIPAVEWYYVFNIPFAVKLNEDVGGIAVIAMSDEYV